MPETRINGKTKMGGRGYFPHDSRHIVPGYYQAVPAGQKPFAPGAPLAPLAWAFMERRFVADDCLSPSSNDERGNEIAAVWAERRSIDSARIRTDFYDCGCCRVGYCLSPPLSLRHLCVPPLLTYEILVFPVHPDTNACMGSDAALRYGGKSR
jgi:hypothetical protein